MRFSSILVLTFLVACTGDDMPDPGMDAAMPDTGVDAAPMPDAEMDAGDAAIDAERCDMVCGEDCVVGDDVFHCGACGLRCNAFERCFRADCDCDPNEPLCYTDGRARWVLDQGNFTLRDGGQVVLDQTTQLLWQRAVDPTRRTAVDAAAYCASLALDGRDDWRVPGRMELVSILDGTRTPSVDPIFEDTPEDYHWTQSNPRFREDRAYSVYFGGGETVTSDAGMAGAFVRCVATDVVDRAQALQVQAEYVDDVQTDLRWDRTVYTGYTQSDAADRCADKGMRLPSLQELQSLVDEAGYQPAIDTFAFPDTPPTGRFWTRTTRDLGVPVAWTVSFASGETELKELDVRYDVRCVRRIP